MPLCVPWLRPETEQKDQEDVVRGDRGIVLDSGKVLAYFYLGSRMLNQGLPTEGWDRAPNSFCTLEKSYHQV